MRTRIQWDVFTAPCKYWGFAWNLSEQTHLDKTWGRMETTCMKGHDKTISVWEFKKVSLSFLLEGLIYNFLIKLRYNAYPTRQLSINYAIWTLDLGLGPSAENESAEMLSSKFNTIIRHYPLYSSLGTLVLIFWHSRFGAKDQPARFRLTE